MTIVAEEPEQHPTDPDSNAEHPLTTIARLATDMGVGNPADRHDRYALHGRSTQSRRLLRQTQLSSQERTRDGGSRRPHAPPNRARPGHPWRQAVVRGTRIQVALVLGHLAGNPDLADLFAAYPRLTVDDVRAVLVFALAEVEASSDRVPQPVGVEPR